MTRPLSNDLRGRLVSAVEGGMTRRSAAKRFGVAASTAIKWVARWRRTGDVGARPQGGDHRSQRLEAHAEEILALIDETPDSTLSELAAHLDDVHGSRVAQSTIWRLLDRHGMTFKKKPRTPANNSGLTSCGAAAPGSTPSRAWHRSAWSSSMRRGHRPRWPAAADGRNAASGARHRCPMGIGRPPPSSARSGSKA